MSPRLPTYLIEQMKRYPAERVKHAAGISDENYERAISGDTLRPATLAAIEQALRALSAGSK